MASQRPSGQRHSGNVERVLCLTLLAGLIGAAAWAAPAVSNVRAGQRADNTGLVDVYYDLAGASGAVYVDLVFSNDNGLRWNVIPTPSLISGDTGFGVPNGTNRHIVWDAGRDRALVHWPQTKAKVRASEVSQTITIMLPGGVPLQLVRIPAGSFTMGSGLDPGWSETFEAPPHTVTIAYDFYLCKYEITQQQWYAVMGSNPSQFVGVNNPVEQVSWNDCQAFITALNALGVGTFRLPSEAEWEYACRAGSTTRFYFSDSSALLANYAWFSGNNASTTRPVGQKLPNAFGLYDMAGNVLEWCQDYWHDNYTGAPTDGSAWETPSSSYRLLRGGSYSSSAMSHRSTFRGSNPPNSLHYSFGLRLVRTP